MQVIADANQQKAQCNLLQREREIERNRKSEKERDGKPLLTVSPITPMCTRLGSSSSSLLSTWSSSSLVSSIVSGLGYTIFLNFVLAKGPEIMKTCTNWMELNLLSFEFQCKLSRYEIKVKYVMGISESDGLSSISVISTRVLPSVSVSLSLFCFVGYTDATILQMPKLDTQASPRFRS